MTSYFTCDNCGRAAVLTKHEVRCPYCHGLNGTYSSVPLGSEQGDSPYFRHADASTTETALELSRRHVREGQERVTAQTSRVEGLKAAGHAIEAAETLLEQMEINLKLSREHLKENERRARDSDTAPGADGSAPPH